MGGSFTATPNLYEWFLGFTRSGTDKKSAAPANAPGKKMPVTLLRQSIKKRVDVLAAWFKKEKESINLCAKAAFIPALTPVQ